MWRPFWPVRLCFACRYLFYGNKIIGENKNYVMKQSQVGYTLYDAYSFCSDFFYSTMKGILEF